MVKNVLLVCMVVAAPSALYASWLDDLATAYDTAGLFDREKALATIEGYCDKAEARRLELGKSSEKSDTKGFWGGVRTGSYQAELSLLNSEIDYYKKVVHIIREFPQNKRQEETFTHAIKKLSRYRKRLEDLRTRYRNSSSVLEKFKLGAAIATKEAQIVGHKTYIKNIII